MLSLVLVSAQRSSASSTPSLSASQFPLEIEKENVHTLGSTATLVSSVTISVLLSLIRSVVGQDTLL